MRVDEDIENIFRKELGHLEYPVDDRMWMKIEQTLTTSKQVKTSSRQSLMDQLSPAKIMIGFAAAFVLIGTVVLIQQKINQTPEQQVNLPANPPSEKQPAVSVSGKGGSQLHFSDQNKSAASENTISKHTEIPVSIEQKKSDHSSEMHVDDEVSIKSDASNTTSSVENKSQEKQTHLTDNKQKIISAYNHSYDAFLHTSEMPSAMIDASTSSGYAPLTVSFTNLGYAKNIKWDFGDGTYAHEMSPTHSYDAAGKYKVLLITTNNIGATDIDTLTIHVLGGSKISFIPNVFSPNQDGYNDLFYIRSEKLMSLHVTIFDPKGEVVYAWDGISEFWDGRKKTGELAPAGTYYYILKAKGMDGQHFDKKGDITLLR